MTEFVTGRRGSYTYMDISSSPRPAPAVDGASRRPSITSGRGALRLLLHARDVEGARLVQIRPPLLVLLQPEAVVHGGLVRVAGAPELGVDVRVVAGHERVDEVRALGVRAVERRVHRCGGSARVPAGVEACVDAYSGELVQLNPLPPFESSGSTNAFRRPVQRCTRPWSENLPAVVRLELYDSASQPDTIIESIHLPGFTRFYLGAATSAACQTDTLGDPGVDAGISYKWYGSDVPKLCSHFGAKQRLPDESPRDHILQGTPSMAS